MAPDGWTPGTALILGGARSGKSAFAERLCEASGRQKVYLATSEVWDDEMGARVALHQSRRGADWTLVEEPLDLVSVLTHHATAKTCLLVDCLTLWLTNLMMQEADIEREIAGLVECAVSLPVEASVLFVSNEVGQGIVPENRMAREFRDHAGRLHQMLAARVPHVWFVTAGLPSKLK